MSPEAAALLGGSALFVYAMQELSKSVQYVAGGQFRAWINSFGKKRVAGILLGMVLSVLLSGSGAVTAMLVGLANARIMTLEQIFSVTLGAGVGSTFIVQLFAFNLSEQALLITFVGVTLEGLSRSDRLTRIARSMTYLGLMFYSISLLIDAGVKLENNELFQYILDYFRNRPLVSFAIAAAISTVLHSSAATIAFVMSLMTARHGTIYDAIPWILGANLGSTTTAYFASFGTGVLGKQAALGNLLCRGVGCVLALPLSRQLGNLALFVGGDVSRQIAVAHTLFNVLLTIIFFPFIPLGVKAVRAMIPENQEDSPFRFQYLDDRTLATPELALAQAQREILRLADTVEQMVEKSIHLFKRGNQKEVETLKAMDQVVDFLNRGIKLYLTKLSQNEMTPEQVQKEFELLLRTNDLENIGDIVDKNILELVKKTIKKGYSFSHEGWQEITSFHAKVIECLQVSTAYFNSRDRAVYAKLMVLHQQIEDLTFDLSEQHMQRLHRGVKESIETTSVHLDLLGNLERIGALAINFTRVHGSRHAVQS